MGKNWYDATSIFLVSAKEELTAPGPLVKHQAPNSHRYLSFELERHLGEELTKVFSNYSGCSVGQQFARVELLGPRFDLLQGHSTLHESTLN